MQDNEIRQKKEACYTDVEKYVLRSCALCCFLFGGTHLTRCFCVLTAVSRLVRSGLWGGGCADPRQRRRRTACCAASPRSATTSSTAATRSVVASVCAFPRLLFVVGAFVADFCLGLLCSLKKGSWIMSAARNTSTACTSKNH